MHIKLFNSWGGEGMAASSHLLKKTKESFRNDVAEGQLLKNLRNLKLEKINIFRIMIHIKFINPWGGEWAAANSHLLKKTKGSFRKSFGWRQNAEIPEDTTKKEEQKRKTNNLNSDAY